MTATTMEAAPLTAEQAAAEHAKKVAAERATYARLLANKVIKDLGCIARVLDGHPELAELLLPAFRSTNLSLHAVRDPEGAKRRIAGAFQGSGAEATPGNYEGCFDGLSVWLPGGAMSLFFYTQSGDPAVAEAASQAAADYAAAAFAKAPEAHDEVPDDEPEAEPETAEPQDDADPLAETAAFDTATEVTAS